MIFVKLIVAGACQSTIDHCLSGRSRRDDSTIDIGNALINMQMTSLLNDITYQLLNLSLLASMLRLRCRYHCVTIN